MGDFRSDLPLGTDDPQVFFANVGNLDEAVTTRESETWVDRKGVARHTWYGMEEAFQLFLINSGYENIGDYGPGLNITARNQIFWKDGELYRASGALALPYTTTGDWLTEESLFVAIGDNSLRQDLTDSSDPSKGASMVGRSVVSVSSLEDLKTIPSGSLREDSEYHVTSYYDNWLSKSPFRGPVGGGVFRWFSGTGLPEDGGVVVNHAIDGQFVRAVSHGNYSVDMWGAACDGVTDDYVAVQNAINFVTSLSSGFLVGNDPANRYFNGYTLTFPGIAAVSQTVTVPRCAQFRLSGGGLAAHNDWVGTGSDFVLGYLQPSDGRFSYNGCSITDFAILGNKKASCLRVLSHNRFTCSNISLTSFTEYGLDVGSGVGNGFEFMLDGATIGEYDWFDTDRDTGRSGTAIRNRSTDGHFRNFVIYNAKFGLINEAGGNQFDKFHVWGVEERAYGVRNTAVHVTFHDFKLGGVSMVLVNPWAVSINGVQCERTRDDQNLYYIVLKSTSANHEMRSVNIRNVEGRGDIGTGTGDTRFIELDESEGTFSRVFFTQSSIENIFSMSAEALLPRGKETTATIRGSTGAGLSEISIPFGERLLFPSMASIVSLFINDPRAEYITTEINSVTNNVIIRNYTTDAHTTPKTFTNYSQIQLTVTCLSS